MRKPRVAIVTQDLRSRGGVGTMTSFLYDALYETGEWEVEIVSLATSASDEWSSRLSNWRTWSRGARAERGAWLERPYTHVGAEWVELETQRYKPRRVLDQVLSSFDLLQFVTGSAAPVCVAARVERPALLWVASTLRADRASRLHHGPPAKRWWSRLMLRLAESQERAGVRLARHVFALSHYTRDAVRALGAQRISLAPCGVDSELFRPAPQLGNYIICVARLYDARKNVPLLLQSYRSLRARVTACPELYLVGEKPTPETVAQLRKLGLQDHVYMLGGQSPGELSHLYRGAKVFVLSSDEEGLGIVILEAMACGLPVISTACGGPSTLIEPGENGFLTPVGNAAALTEAMERVLTDNDLAGRMGTRSRELAVARFSKEAVAGIFVDQYTASLAHG